MRLHCMHDGYITSHGDELPRPPVAFGCLLALVMVAVGTGAIMAAVWMLVHDPGLLAWSLLALTALSLWLMGAGARRR